MKKEFKVGQVWRMRNGENITITRIFSGGIIGIHNVTDESIKSDIGHWHPNGAWTNDQETNLDLVELIEETEERQEFKMGQTWSMRNGLRCVVTYVYPDGSLSTDNGKRYPNGAWASDSQSGKDLIELVERPAFTVTDDKTQAMDAVGELPTLNMNFPCVYPVKALPEISELVKMHAEWVKRAGSRPYPSIIVSENFTTIYGINGDIVVQRCTEHLEEMKAATGYPVYVMTRLEFEPIAVYEVRK